MLAIFCGFLFVLVLIVWLALLARELGWRRVNGRILINKPPTEEQILGSFAPYPKLADFLQRVRQSATHAELQSIRAEVVANCKGWKRETPFGKTVSTLYALIDIKQETIRLQDRVNTATSREELHVLEREIDDLARKRGWSCHAILGEQMRQLVAGIEARLVKAGAGDNS